MKRRMRELFSFFLSEIATEVIKGRVVESSLSDL